MSDWDDDFFHWLTPFLTRLGHKARRKMCPLYVAGLIGADERKSMEPIAARVAALKSPPSVSQKYKRFGLDDEVPAKDIRRLHAERAPGLMAASRSIAPLI